MRVRAYRGFSNPRHFSVEWSAVYFTVYFWGFLAAALFVMGVWIVRMRRERLRLAGSAGGRTVCCGVPWR